jgi:filamentous hemagglutinin
LTSAQVIATGNVTGGNLTTAGLITATGNVTGGNLTTAGLITATGNVTGGNIATAGTVSATANVTGGNIITAGAVSATGNVVSVANVNGANINATTGIHGNIFTTLIDSGDSSLITFVPDVLMLASLEVQQDVFVQNLVSTRDLDVTGRAIISGYITVPSANVTTLNAGNITASGNIIANNISANTSINIAGEPVATIADAVALAIALG